MGSPLRAATDTSALATEWPTPAPAAVEATLAVAATLTARQIGAGTAVAQGARDIIPSVWPHNEVCPRDGKRVAHASTSAADRGVTETVGTLWLLGLDTDLRGVGEGELDV